MTKDRNCCVGDGIDISATVKNCLDYRKLEGNLHETIGCSIGRPTER